MKGKIRIAGVALLILIVLAGSAGTIFYFSARDYKSTLMTGRGVIPAMQEDEAGNPDPGPDKEKIEADINKLNDLEQLEDADAPMVSEDSGNVVQDSHPAVVSSNDPPAPAAEKQDEGPPPTLPPHEGNLVNVLFLGLDRTLNRDKTLGVYRTDAITLASINLDTKKVEMLSIPRDTYVYIPKIGRKDKINHAYVWGGMGNKGITSTIETVNRFLKYSTVDYYFCIDMEPVPKIIDDLGGVEMYVDVDMTKKGYNLRKGQQLLNGEKAMQFIRWRYSGAGDLDRIKRQQKLSSAMLDKLKQEDQLLNAVKIVLSYSKYVRTNMNLQQLLSFATLASEVTKGSTNYHIVSGRSSIIKKVWYWIPDEKKTDKVLQDMFDQGS